MSLPKNPDEEYSFERESISMALQAIIQHNAPEAERILRPLKPELEEIFQKRDIRKEEKAYIFARDHYICRYCGRYTISIPALRYLSELYPELLPYHSHGKTDKTHPLYWEAYPMLDHLHPIARGGTNERDNLVTACVRCNMLKSDRTLEYLGWQLRDNTDNEWDGLTTLFLRAMEVHPSKVKELIDWRKAILRVVNKQYL